MVQDVQIALPVLSTDTLNVNADILEHIRRTDVTRTAYGSTWLGGNAKCSHPLAYLEYAGSSLLL